MAAMMWIVRRFACGKSTNARDRTPFLEAVAARLHGMEIGDGVVARIVCETQRASFFRAPELDADDYAARRTQLRFGQRADSAFDG
jgi:hypothetical protein